MQQLFKNNIKNIENRLKYQYNKKCFLKSGKL